MSGYKELDKEDYKRLFIRECKIGIVMILAFPLIFLMKIPGLIIFLLIVGLCLFLFVRGLIKDFASSKGFSFRCPECGHEFYLHILKFFITPGVSLNKYTKCPRCRTRSMMMVLKEVNE
jgi:DNA-directed RNA polymerase subunit RPC12/RpoP